MLGVAVNLSPLNLRFGNFVSVVEEALAQSGVAAKWLTLELTENAIMFNPQQALGALNELNLMGVYLSVDDFGTGYSSLAYLKRLPVDEIKIDKSFVMEMDKDKDDEAIVRSTIDLAHNLGLKVIAEGIETEQVWNRLVELGCDLGQGYYMSRPVDVKLLDEWLNSSPWGLR